MSIFPRPNMRQMIKTGTPLKISGGTLAHDYAPGVDDPVSCLGNVVVRGTGIASVSVEPTGIVDADEAMEITYGGTTYTIDLGTDGATTLYGTIYEPDFVATVASGVVTLTKGAD